MATVTGAFDLAVTATVDVTVQPKKTVSVEVTNYIEVRGSAFALTPITPTVLTLG